MTDRATQDLAALLNEPESSELDDAVRRAALACALKVALEQAAESNAQSGQDSVTLAAHLDGGLAETDRQALLYEATHSPEALADLEASAALLETVARHPQSVSAEQAAQARAIFGAAQPAKRSRWAAGFATVSPLRLGLSFAALAAVALVVIIAPFRQTERQIGPTTNVGQTSSEISAFLPAGPTGAAPKPTLSHWRVSAAPAPDRNQGWTAVALSSSGRVYGTAFNWPTEAEAKLVALATCAKQGPKDCTLAATANGQCISAAVLGDAAPTTVQSGDRAAAERKALEACGGGACFVVITSCSGNSPP